MTYILISVPLGVLQTCASLELVGPQIENLCPDPKPLIGIWKNDVPREKLRELGDQKPGLPLLHHQARSFIIYLHFTSVSPK